MWTSPIYVTAILGYLNTWHVPGVWRTWKILNSIYNICLLSLQLFGTVLITMSDNGYNGFSQALRRGIKFFSSWVTLLEMMILLYNSTISKTVKQLLDAMKQYQSAYIETLSAITKFPLPRRRILIYVGTTIMSMLLLSSVIYITYGDLSSADITKRIQRYFPSIPAEVGIAAYYLDSFFSLLNVVAMWSVVILLLCTVSWICRELQRLKRWVVNHCCMKKAEGISNNLSWSRSMEMILSLFLIV